MTSRSIPEPLTLAFVESIPSALIYNHVGNRRSAPSFDTSRSATLSLLWHTVFGSQFLPHADTLSTCL